MRRVTSGADASGWAEQVVGRCRELAAVSEEQGRLTRRFASPAMARANELVGRLDGRGGDGGARRRGRQPRGAAAGADPGPDVAARLAPRHGARRGRVRRAARRARRGRLRRAAARGGGALPFAIDVLGFSGRGGAALRHGVSRQSRGGGSFDPALLELRDEDGVALGDALRAFGGDPEAVGGASRRGERLLGYCELHIEQGPVLEGRGVPVGVVSAIAGATRAELEFSGRAGHAGTVPMDARQDAACAAAEWVLAVEAAARREPGLVATVGRLEARPGAPNVVPGAAVASLDVRHPEDAVRAAAVAALRDAGGGDRRGARRRDRVARGMSAPAVAWTRPERRAGRGGGRGAGAGAEAGERRRARRRGAQRADGGGDALRALRRRDQPPPRRGRSTRPTWPSRSTCWTRSSAGWRR